MPKDRPIIGLVCQHESESSGRYFVQRSYVQAVINAGGTPILIPYQSKDEVFRIFQILDGVVLTGGIDLDPARYGQDPHVKCGEIDPHRDELDLMAAGFALERNLPLLGICRGNQVLNVALGGTLVQDIPAQIKDPLKHSQEAPRWYATHDIVIKSASLLAEIWGNQSQKVNSYHHQSIAQPGKGLRIVATASDGVVEAVESTEHRFVLGLQWHPELMVEHYASAASIFQHFIQAAAVS